jgi:large subunit ribosomal protein L7Ae
MSEQAFEIIEIAKKTGALKKGANEVTKAIERGKALFVAVAEDVSPKEITMHIPLLAKEKNIPCVTVSSREELGTASGLAIPTVAVAVVNAGDAKKLIDSLKTETDSVKEESSVETTAEKQDETKSEEKAESADEEKTEE